MAHGPGRANPVPPALAASLPGDIIVAARRIGSLEDLTLEARRLGFGLPAALRSAVEKRRREYLAGRISARYALARHLGEAEASGEISADADDVPCWPDDVVGSISHGAGFGFAAVAPARRCLGLGVDVEGVVSPRRAGRLSQRVLNAREMELRQGRSGALTEAEMFTLAFSAKESAYKALFPRHRRVLGFSDVALERRDGWRGAERAGTLRLRVVSRTGADATEGLFGWYAMAGVPADAAGGVTARVCTVVVAGPATDWTRPRASGRDAEPPGEPTRRR